MKRLAFVLGLVLGLLAGTVRAQCVGGVCYPVRTQIRTIPSAQAPLSLAPRVVDVPGEEIIVRQQAPRVIELPREEIIVRRGAPRVTIEAQTYSGGGGCYGGSYSGSYGFYDAPSVGISSSVVGSIGGFSAGSEIMVDEYGRGGLSYPYGYGHAAAVGNRTRNRLLRAGVNRGANISVYGPNEFDVIHRGLLRRIFD